MEEGEEGKGRGKRGLEGEKLHFGPPGGILGNKGNVEGEGREWEGRMDPRRE